MANNNQNPKKQLWVQITCGFLGFLMVLGTIVMLVSLIG